MPQPTISDVHVNIPLTNLTLLARQDDQEFVADEVFPILPVEHRSDVYYVYDEGDFIRNQMAVRGPGAESNGAGYRLDNTSTYLCPVWSLHKDIPDQVRANADSMLAPDTEAVYFLSDQARLNREIQWATSYFATGLWTTEVAGVTSGATGVAAGAGGTVLYWSDGASTPIEDIRAMKQQIQLAGLKRPNTLTVSRGVFDILCDHPELVDRIKYGQTGPQPAKVLAQTMATLFELDRVLIMDAIKNTAVEDPAWTAANRVDNSFSFVGGKNALLSYRPAAPGLMTPAAGYTFAWTGFLGAAATGTRIKTYYLPWLESTRVEIDNAFVQKIVNKTLAGFFNGIIA